ncbi:MAG: hypothetical protein M1839_008172 [Geoglossum umbratile]|nr:MAG: hypothetical protein M1839_008172 [Geoglossum umbratile]
MKNLSRLLLFSLLPVALAAPSAPSAPDLFYMASLGDSWAGGAAVVPKDMYDNSGCHRNKAAWEAQMAGDKSWTDSPIDFKFLACSGAQLVAAAKGDNENGQPDPQLKGAGTPHLLTMELGGNNCHFADIARKCIYVGLDGKEYPDPNGGCYQSLTEWGNYILSDLQEAGKSFYFDHHQTLIDIMNWDTIKGRNDFYLYIIGYAEFFNTSPGSDWCNDKSFGIVRSPKLSNALRSKINELVRNVNSKVAQSIKDMNNDHIKFLDVSPLYEGHRFCEPGHSYSNQYYLNDVWFWNLSPPETDPDYLAGLLSTILPIWQAMWLANHTFPNGTQATQEQLEAMVGSSDSSSSGRTFHPKAGGHTATKDAMIDLLRKDNVPGVKQATPVKPPPKQPYASGQVHIHILEYWGCLDNDNNLSVDITMWDSASTQIGHMGRTQAGASASAKMGSKLEDQLIVTPEWAKGGYIQFQLGGLQFNTNDNTDSSKPVYCNVGGYDPRQGPRCYIFVGDQVVFDPKAVAIAQMDCFFPAVSSPLLPLVL